jgi:hypothetical protein
MRMSEKREFYVKMLEAEIEKRLPEKMRIDVV